MCFARKPISWSPASDVGETSSDFPPLAVSFLEQLLDGGGLEAIVRAVYDEDYADIYPED
jgi:hypothetical protein